VTFKHLALLVNAGPLMVNAGAMLVSPTAAVKTAVLLKELRLWL